MPELSDYLKIGDVAEYLGISKDTLRRWDRAGKLAARRYPVSRYRLYLRKELDALLGQVDETEKVGGRDQRNDSAEWRAFAKKLRRLLHDGLRLRKRPDFAPKRYQSRIDRPNRRIGEMAQEEHTDADARRLTKRLRRYGEYLFTFLDYPFVATGNNFGERQIRPAVILRKNSQSNRSDASPP